MAINLPSCLSIQFLEQLLKFLISFTLLKYIKSQRSYGFLITKELIFGFQILDLKYHFSASLIIEILYLKQIFLETDSSLLAETTSTSHMQTCFKIDVGFIKLCNV